MKVLVIIAHRDRNSFSHTIAAACAQALKANGHEVLARDLYTERFDPLLPAVAKASEGSVCSTRRM